MHNKKRGKVAEKVGLTRVTSGPYSAIAAEGDGINAEEAKKGRQEARKQTKCERQQEVEESLCGNCVNFAFQKAYPGCEKAVKTGVVSGAASGWVISAVVVGDAP